jgi:hypothetical protein
MSETSTVRVAGCSSEVLAEGGRAGVELYGLGELLSGLSEVAALDEHHAQVVVNDGVRRFDLLGAAQDLDGLVELPALPESHCQIEEQRHVCRAESGGRLQLLGGFCKAAGMKEVTSKVVAGFEIVGVETKRVAVSRFCFVGFVSSLVSRGEQVSQLRAEVEPLRAVAPGRGCQEQRSDEDRDRREESLVAPLSQRSREAHRAGAGQNGQRRDERDSISPDGEDRDQHGSVARKKQPDRPRDPAPFRKGA